MIAIGLVVLETYKIEIVNAWTYGRRTHGRRLDYHTLTSPCEPSAQVSYKSVQSILRILNSVTTGYKKNDKFKLSLILRQNDIKVIGLNAGIWLFRTCSASFDHLIGEKTRMYFAKSLSDSIMNSYSLLPNITILIKQCISMALQRI